METKQLRTLLKLLREQGVTQYTTPELSLTISEREPASLRPSPAADISDEDELTPEEEAERLLFYSATPPTESPEQ